MKKNIFTFSVLALIGLTLTSCRGDKSSASPVLLIRNMVDQTSYGPQSQNDFYKDSNYNVKNINSGQINKLDNIMKNQSMLSLTILECLFLCLLYLLLL